MFLLFLKHTIALLIIWGVVDADYDVIVNIGVWDDGRFFLVKFQRNYRHLFGDLIGLFINLAIVQLKYLTIKSIALFLSIFLAAKLIIKIKLVIYF